MHSFHKNMGRLCEKHEKRRQGRVRTTKGHERARKAEVNHEKRRKGKTLRTTNRHERARKAVVNHEKHETHETPWFGHILNHEWTRMGTKGRSGHERHEMA